MTTPWQKCAREGCNRQFRAAPQHGKKFCGKKCRNRVMVARYRERYQEMKKVQDGLGAKKMKEMRIP